MGLTGQGDFGWQQFNLISKLPVSLFCLREGREGACLYSGSSYPPLHLVPTRPAPKHLNDSLILKQLHSEKQNSRHGQHLSAFGSSLLNTQSKAAAVAQREGVRSSSLTDGRLAGTGVCINFLYFWFLLSACFRVQVLLFTGWHCTPMNPQ